MAGAADDIAGSIIAKWSDAFAKLDADALSALYSRHALFFGSNPTLYRGRDGVKAYFAGLPGWRSQSVRFSDVSAEAAGAEVVNMAGTANFVVDDATLTVKLTWVILCEDGDWKIVSHHVSSREPLIDHVR
ncbi:nuclear transport factor 2 family protein [Bradyrhizobium sp.]|uniref:nuclear transport factor 2 family protein n=1 Tax=Bradyrhizobium sp. TaxID=376 RepID=UPI0040382595